MQVLDSESNPLPIGSMAWGKLPVTWFYHLLNRNNSVAPS